MIADRPDYFGGTDKPSLFRCNNRADATFRLETQNILPAERVASARQSTGSLGSDPGGWLSSARGKRRVTGSAIRRQHHTLLGRAHTINYPKDKRPQKPAELGFPWGGNGKLPERVLGLSGCLAEAAPVLTLASFWQLSNGQGLNRHCVRAT
jgi:hypothetical protein